MEVVNTVGRRKSAVARVYVKPGKGTITVNHKPMETYFPLDIFQYVVKQPLLVLENPESYDITINLTGGGIHGQAEAARLGIARALIEINPEWRGVMKKNGFLTRDSREVERRNPVSQEHAGNSSSASVSTTSPKSTKAVAKLYRLPFTGITRMVALSRETRRIA